MRFFKRLIAAWLFITAFDVGVAVRAQNAIVYFQSTTAANTALQLPSNVLYNGLFCVPSTSNTVQVYFGGNSSLTTSNGVAISNGQIWYAGVSNSNQVWVYSTVISTIGCWGN